MRPKRWSLGSIKALVVISVTLLLVPGAWAKPQFKVLASVPGGLWTGLTIDSKGNLYGVTSGGGTNGVGSVFELSLDSKGKWRVTTLHSFDGTDGSSPKGNLICDAAGNLYGTANDGGLYDRGAVFELTPGSGGWTFAVIYNFCPQYNCLDGAEPAAGVTADKTGNLYGTAGGGPDCCGVFYELTPGSGGWEESVLYDFGSKPYDATASTAPLIFSKTGDLYGTSYYGGSFGGGAVFKLTHKASGWKERILYSFCPGGFPCVDGQHPFSGVVLDRSGSLYGTTTQGGGNTCGETHCGAVFKLTRAGNGHWKETVLYEFKAGASGSFPGGGVVFGKGGALYGTTALGGVSRCNGGCGVVYKLTPDGRDTWKYSILHKFDGTDGGLPEGALAFDNKGNLYGTAYSVVYEITP